jgi:hypothetical protein
MSLALYTTTCNAGAADIPLETINNKEIFTLGFINTHQYLSDQYIFI